MKPFDLVCIGAGAASLSLLTRLVEHYPGRIALIEQAQTLSADRTWCGWSLRPHPFSDVVTQRWQQWAVSSAHSHTVQTGPFDYEMLSSAAVQTKAQSAIGTRKDWWVQMGCTVIDKAWSGSHWQLTLSSGETLTTRWVLDSTPPQIQLRRPWLWQSFVGYELRGVAPTHPKQVQLMAFRPVTKPAIVGFFYELPIAANQCLLEWTVFTREQPNFAELQAALDAECDRRGWQGAERLRTEQSHLPMQPIHPKPQPHWLPIGTAGGAMRPATGYAFHAIQRWADACAQALLQGQDPVLAQRPKWLDWMDGVFLESLWQAGSQAPERFVQLFERAPSASVTQFLMSEPSWRDTLRIMQALPKIPLMKAALTRGWRR